MRELPPEFSLAAACSIWPPSERRTEIIYRTAQAALDWNRFLRIINRHRVVGLVHEGIANANVSIPHNIAEKISARATALVHDNLALAAEAIRLARIFSEASIPVLFIKGPSLAALAYGNLGLRESKDLDLLVPFDSLPTAIVQLERAGYERSDPPASASEAQMKLLMPLRKDFGYINHERKIEIELHWRLLSNLYFMDETSIISSSRIVPITGTNGLRTLGQDDLFAYLCAHGAQHWWYQLKWLADIGVFLAAGPNFATGLYQSAEKKGVGNAAAQAILLCHRLLQTPIPDELGRSLRRRLTVKWLEATALNAIAAGHGQLEPRQILFGTTRGSLSCFLLGRTWRYWLSEFRVHSICQTDILTFVLPQSLQFLYPLLRLPFWIWRRCAQFFE